MGTVNENRKNCLYLFEKNFDTLIDLKALAEAVEEMREIKNLETIYLQMDNARYYWTNEALEIYRENNMMLIDWLSYSGGLNPIENIWVIMKHKLEGRNFVTLTSLKNELYSIWTNLE